MTHDEGRDDISITLSPVQVEQVVCAASRTPRGMVTNLLLAALDNADNADNADDPLVAGGQGHEGMRHASLQALEAAMDDPQLSQSLLRGLSVLACYGPDRPWRTIVDLADELRMSPSTTHRYVKTLKAVGLLEQDPSTREYRPVAVSRG